ncbi:MAG: serine hydrolase domain-containing protein [Bacilli bacterium]
MFDLEKYIDEMLIKQNEGGSNEQKNLFSKADYYKLLKPVMEVIHSNKDNSLTELRTKLYEQSKIEEKVKNFIYNRKMAPGVVFSYGTKNFKETVVAGDRQEVTLNENGQLVPATLEMTENTIFDLASVTKLFTSLSVLKLVESGDINLADDVVKYAPEFKNLKGISIFDLLTFNQPLKTNGRIDKVSSKEEAETILFDIQADLKVPNSRLYTDMGAMVLKYVIEKVSTMDFYPFVSENILKKLDLNDTHVLVPASKIDRVVNTNYDGRLYKDGNFMMTTEAEKGTAYDAKARIMGQKEGVLSGHAGMFSTADDMTKLAKGMIDASFIDEDYIRKMAKNRTGNIYYDDKGNKKFTQYLGMLCYSKNPILGDSEVFHALSGNSLASAGWTGMQLTIDPANELYFFMGANRSHNRMTFIDSEQKHQIKTGKDGENMLVLPDGNVKIDATKFAWERDDVVVYPALKLAIQYKMLEDIYGIEKEKIPAEEKVSVKQYKK